MVRDTANEVEKVIESIKWPPPPSPPVIAWKAEEYVNSEGDESVRLTMAIPDDFPEHDLKGDFIIDLKDLVLDALQNKGIIEFPYILIVKTSEFEEAEDSSNA